MTFFRLKRWVQITIGLVILALCYSAWQLRSIDKFGYQDNKENADCAIVLGAAAWHTEPSPVLKERINHAIQLYKAGRVKKLLLTGGFGKGADYAESEVARNYAIKEGVPANDILIEKRSDKTSENLAEASQLMRDNQLSSALIVSDPWHLKRACIMAEDAGIKSSPSATTTSRFRSKTARLKFLLQEFYNLHHYYLFRE